MGLSDDRGGVSNSNWVGYSQRCVSEERGSMGNSKRSSMSKTKRSSMSDYWSTMESMSSMRDEGTMSTNHLMGANKGGGGSSSQTSKGSNNESLHLCSIVV